MPVRPLAAYRQRPVHKSVVRKNTDIDVITLLTEGEPLSVRAMRKPMKVLKGDAVEKDSAK
jgi:hypothetical protein